MKPNHPTTWQPIRPRAGAELFMGLRASIGRADASRVAQAIRQAYGEPRGGGVPNGIVLKEGET